MTARIVSLSRAIRSGAIWSGLVLVLTLALASHIAPGQTYGLNSIVL